MTRPPVSGPLLMVAATFAFTTMVALARLARAEVDGVALVFWRALVSLPLLVLAARGALRLVVHEHRRALALRCLLGFGALSSFFVAAGSVYLLTLALIMRSQPSLVTLVAPYVLERGEYTGRGAIVAAVVGFAGTAMVAAPDLETGDPMIFFAFLAPILSGGAHLALRRVAPTTEGTTIVTWFHLTLVPLALGVLALRGEALSVPSGNTLWWVIGVGVAATAGQLLVTRAYRVERASLVASASYASVLFALGYDLLLFGIVPSWWALPGGTLIVGSSLWLIRRAQRRRALGVAS